MRRAVKLARCQVTTTFISSHFQLFKFVVWTPQSILLINQVVGKVDVKADLRLVVKIAVLVSGELAVFLSFTFPEIILSFDLVACILRRQPFLDWAPWTLTLVDRNLMLASTFELVVSYLLQSYFHLHLLCPNRSFRGFKIVLESLKYSSLTYYGQRKLVLCLPLFIG